MSITVRIRVSDRIRVSGRDIFRFRVSVRISNISITCHHVANVELIYTAAMSKHGLPEILYGNTSACCRHRRISQAQPKASMPGSITHMLIT